MFSIQFSLLEINQYRIFPLYLIILMVLYGTILLLLRYTIRNFVNNYIRRKNNALFNFLNNSRSQQSVQKYPSHNKIPKKKKKKNLP